MLRKSNIVKASNLSTPLLSNSGLAVKLLLKSPIPLCLRANSWKDRAEKEFTARENVSSPSRNNTFMVLMKLRFSAKRARASPVCGIMTFSPNSPMNCSKLCGPEDFTIEFQYIFSKYLNLTSPWHSSLSVVAVSAGCSESEHWPVSEEVEPVLLLEEEREWLG